MTLFIPAETKQQFNQIAKLADVIWREHYTPIIGIDQVEYMIKKFQSTETMYTQYTNGYQYFLKIQSSLYIINVYRIDTLK